MGLRRNPSSNWQRLTAGAIVIFALTVACTDSPEVTPSSEDVGTDASQEDTGDDDAGNHDPLPGDPDADGVADASGDTDVSGEADVDEEPDAAPDADTGNDADVDDEYQPTEGMALVPAGTYRRGCDDEVDGDCSILELAQPAHEVYVSTFEIDIHPVTEAEYDACVADGQCTEPHHDSNYDGSGDDYPVVNVTSEQALNYCQWRGMRLPTEAEWEKAARGDDERPYPWGFDEPDCSLANYDECGGEIEPVGLRPDGASPYGVEEMAGNVRNWTLDWFDGDYYEDSPSEDPMGPDSGETRAVRGAGFFHGEGLLPVWTRHSMEVPGHGFETGFRCAQPVDH